MDKKEALRILFETAKSYKENLCDKNLLFVTINKHNKVEIIETVFKKSNFLHLTGIQVYENTNITDIDILQQKEIYSKANKFFDKCISKRLSEKDFEFSEDGKTILKLEVLPLIVTKNLSAKMFGLYNNSKPALYTERLIGGVSACLGFVKIKNNNYYVPNTLLNQDIRTITTGYNRVVAVYRKHIKEHSYSELVYLAKKVTLDNYKFPKEFNYLKNIKYSD